MAELDPAHCEDCNARLSRYRKSREKHCAPCQQRRITQSLNEAHKPQRLTTKAQEAFALRWRGYEWPTIQRLIGYPTPNAAQSAAREYAKRKGLTLP
jgi:hypothetical protein